MEKFFGNYKGVVIQNDDPIMGRVKVYVPEVMPTLYKEWNEDKETDKIFTFPGDNTSPAFTKDKITKLQKILPWAEVKQPIFGLSQAGKYNASSHSYSIENGAAQSIQQDKINSASTGTTTDAAGNSQNTYASSPESALIKTLEALAAISSLSNATDINNYLNCNAAPPSVSTAANTNQSSSNQSSGGLGAIGDNIDTFAYVANARTPDFFQYVNPENPSFPNISVNSPQPTQTLTEKLSVTTTTISPTVAFYTSDTPPDNIESVNLKFKPTASFIKSLGKKKGQQKGLTNEVASILDTSYEQTIISISPDNTNPALTAVAQRAAPIVYTLIREIPALITDKYIPIVFETDTTAIQNTSKLNDDFKKIKIGAENIVYDGINFSFLLGKQNVTIPKTTVSQIEINYMNAKKRIKLDSSRLGEIATFLREYTTPASSAFTKIIIPPASIPLPPLNYNVSRAQATGTGSSVSIVQGPSSNYSYVTPSTSSVSQGAAKYSSSGYQTRVCSGCGTAVPTINTSGSVSEAILVSSLPTSTSVALSNPNSSTNDQLRVCTGCGSSLPSGGTTGTVDSPTSSGGSSAIPSSSSGGSTNSSATSPTTLANQNIASALTPQEILENKLDCSQTSSGTYNRGSGSGEMFTTIASNLLPILNINNSQCGGACTSSLASVNHGNTLSESADPNKTVGSNLQSTPESNPPARSPTQNNKAKGIISTPGVGAHVSVYFEYGNPMYPIVDGAFYNAEDWMGVHDVSYVPVTSPSSSQSTQQQADSQSSGTSNDTPTAAANNSQLTGAQARLSSSVYGNAYASDGKILDYNTYQEIKTGVLQPSDQYTGAGGASLVPNQSVAFNRIPLGSTVRITDASSGQPINYNNTNPTGTYTISDHGGPNVDYKIDFYAGGDRAAYNYYNKNVGIINVEVVEYGSGRIKKGRTPLFQ